MTRDNGSSPGYRPTPKPSTQPFVVRSVPELIRWQPPHIDYIVDKGLLWPKSRMVIFGLWKSWKSMLAQDLGFSIAEGVPWLGFATLPRKVLNLQLEIPEFLLRERVMQYAAGHQSFPQGLHYWTQHYLKLDRDYGIHFLEDVLSREHPDVLIIDPIYKVITGNISDSYDVSKFLDNVDLLMEKWNLAVVLVHHERKPQMDSEGKQLPSHAADMMGSSYLLNWLDTGVMLERIGGPNSSSISVTFDPLRHAREELPTLSVTFDRQSLAARLMNLTTATIWKE